MEAAVNDALERLKSIPPKSIAKMIGEMAKQAADRRISYKELWEALVDVPWTGDASRTAISKKLTETIAFCNATTFAC